MLLLVCLLFSCKKSEKFKFNNLNKCTPHSRYFSDELGVQFF